MTHTIKNQHDKHILDTPKTRYRTEIEYMLSAGLDAITIDNSRISVIYDYRNTEKGLRETIVNIEWL